VSQMRNAAAAPLTRLQKLIYGSGDWSKASFNVLRQLFYAIFLTDVVGLDARLASLAALISIVWDAVNDPIIGALSDNVRTRWGRRRPFILLFAVPFALAFVLLWWAPPWQSQVMLMIHVTLAYMVSDTLQTLVTVPYLSLTPELAKDYDERTSLTSYRMFFNLLASLATAVAAPGILDAVVKAGYSQQQGYVTVGALFGGLAVLPLLLIFFSLREQDAPPQPPEEQLTFRKTIRVLWANRPFRFAAGFYVLNWISFDVVGLMLPYYLLYWVGEGNLLAKVNLLGVRLPLESAIFGVLLITATAAIPLWGWLARRFSKRFAYIAGMGFWIGVQLLIYSLQPQQTTLMLMLAALAGLSVSTAHVLPEAIFPDVIDWDELRTHTRREGMYYGAINFIRKLSSALATFITLQFLGWFGYQAPPADAQVFTQSETTLQVIRLLTGPFVAVLLIGAIGFAWFYPLSRERQKRIRRALERRYLFVKEG